MIDRRAFLASAAAMALSCSRRSPEPAAEIDIFRTFGACSDAYGGVTDLALARGECGVIQVLFNQFVAKHKSANVRTVNVPWGAYYDRLGAAFAADAAPDVALMHASVLPDFVHRDLLFPVTGVDLDDLVTPARDAVTFDGRAMALPFDAHGLLWHVNLDVLDKAGLVDNNRPVLPSSPATLLEHAERVRNATGKRYFVIPSASDPMPVWIFQTWVWQQGADLLSSDGRDVTIDTPEAHVALGLLASLFERGHARTIDYASAEQVFLAGEAAVTINGTWLVDVHDAETRDETSGLRRYRAMTPPRLFAQDAAWMDHHVWTLPRARGRSQPHPLAVAFLAHFFENSGAWASTGHLPTRRSVLASDWFRGLPHRAAYARTSEIARSLPRVERRRTIQAILADELNAVWLVGRDSSEALASAERRIERALRA